MSKKYKLPILVLNLKNYQEIFAKNALKIAIEAQKISQEYSIDIVICPPNPLLYYMSNDLDISVFAQHVDFAKIGSSTGAIVPELLNSIGVAGSLINHSEKRISFDQIENIVKKFKELDLLSLVCAQTVEEVKLISQLNPDLIAIEPPELIGSGRAVSKVNPDIISDSVNAAHSVNSNVNILCGAGIMNDDDVKIALNLGSKGILIASGVIQSNNWDQKITELVSAFI